MHKQSVYKWVKKTIHCFIQQFSVQGSYANSVSCQQIWMTIFYNKTAWKMHEANIIPFLFYLMNLQSQTLSVDILANIFTAFYSMIKVRVQKREIVSFHQKDKRDVIFLKFILVKLRWNERHNEMVEFEWDLDTYILNPTCSMIAIYFFAFL